MYKMDANGLVWDWEHFKENHMATVIDDGLLYRIFDSMPVVPPEVLTNTELRNKLLYIHYGDGEEDR